MPYVQVIESGITLAKQSRFDGLVISCGLAGGLREDLPTGTVLVPRSVRRPDGSEFKCDAAAVQALTHAAKQLGYGVTGDALVTTQALVYGERRKTWAARGYAGVDMETGLLHAPHVACVRVILDTPLREISPAWLRPWTVFLRPGAWHDLPFLLREAPRCAAIAAQIAVRAAAEL
jgi:hypothetical protein